MGNIGDDIPTSVPAVGSAGPGYATDINAILTEVMARLEAKIPLSSLLTNSNLDFNGQAITNVGYAQFVNTATSPGASPANRIVVYGGDFWFVGPGGAVKITSGASLNAAGIGGITGDYVSAGPMQFRYDTANTRYDAFANQGTNTWAYVRGRGFDIAGGASSAVRLRQLWGGTANQTITWPSTLPSGAKVVQVDTAGNLSYSNTISGFGHGDRVQSFQTTLENVVYISGGAVGRVYFGATVGVSLPASGENQFSIDIEPGARVKSISVVGTSAGANPGFVLYTQNDLSYSTSIAATTSGTMGGGGQMLITLTTPQVISGGQLLWLKLTPTATTNVYLLKVTYDRPEA